MADSYTSHGHAAPAPPAFSIPRKRLSSIPFFDPVPSARSLKPAGETSTNSTPGRRSSSPLPPTAAMAAGAIASLDSSLHRPPPSPWVSASCSSSYNTGLSKPRSRQSMPVNVSRGGSGIGSPSDPPSNLPRNSASNPASKPPSKPPSGSTTQATTPRSRTPAPARSSKKPPPPSHKDILSGRYGGGYQYGYEAGVGTGGSAGLRVLGTKASRKSIAMSKDFGLDLSEVPILAPKI